MQKLFSDLAEAIEWIWLTPEEARRLLAQREPAERREAREPVARAA
jgi:hypothetical protein